MNVMNAGTLMLGLLGPPRLTRNDQSVDISRRKALAILVYLAVTAQPHTRDTLATLFWPETSQNRARGNLRRVLSDLNREVGQGILLLDGETVALTDEQCLWLDVREFRDYLMTCTEHGHSPDETCPDCVPLLEKAVNLYQTDFLTGFTLRDAPEFDDWQYFEREGLRQEYASALERLVNGLNAQAKYAEAITYARRWVALDNLHEPAQRQLMRLYALAGRRHEALRQYQTCLDVLETELGESPSPETATLYQKIVNGDITLSVPPSPKSLWLPSAPIGVEIEGNVPLVGRAQELETIRTKIQTGLDKHQGCTIFLTGNSGVGKTRLAYEILQAMAQADTITLVGAAYEQEGHLAYHPFIEAFDRYLNEQRHSSAENPITHYKPMGVSDLQKENTALFQATALFITRLTSTAPVLLFLDDVHAADEASLSMFHYLARQTRSAPFVLLATYRTDIGQNGLSPFGSLLNALYREQLSESFQLKPLSQEAGAKIINHTLNGSADPALVDQIYQVAEGNPFYVQEITRAMLKAGHLYQEQGQWHLPSGQRLHVPTELRDLLRERVQRLGTDVASTLTVAAVVGREFDFAILRQATDLADGDIFDALDSALEAHLLEETDNGYRFHHSLIRHTLYNSLSRRRRAWLHTHIATAIERTYAQRPDGLTAYTETLAYHYDLSDQRHKALPFLAQAAQKAKALFALKVAKDYLERALVLMDEIGFNDLAYRWTILEQLGDLANVLADTNEAVAYYEEALTLFKGEQRHPELNDSIRLHRSSARCLITAGRIVEAERHLENAMEILVDIGQASLDYANLLYDVSLWQWHNHEYQQSFDSAEQSLRVAEQLDDMITKAQAYEMLALACHSLGEWQQGLTFEQQRSTLIGPNLDVTEAFDAHL